MTETSDRGPDGRFIPGGPGGPGRPRRAVELDYARTLAEACSLDDWRAICERAVSDAKDGDKGAREFLATRLLGDRPLNLMMLALRDRLSVSSDDELQSLAELETETAREWGITNTPLQRVLANRARARETADREDQARAEAEERARRRAERDARKMRALETQLGAPHVEGAQ